MCQDADRDSSSFPSCVWLQALLALDLSHLTGTDLASMVARRSHTRANLAPYSWGDLNEVAGPRTLGSYSFSTVSLCLLGSTCCSGMERNEKALRLFLLLCDSR